MEKQKARLRLSGRFIVECYREGKLLWREDVRNLIMDQGINHGLNVIFHGSVQIDPWYCCLVETDTAEAAGQTYAVPVYTECETYDELTRPEYVEAISAAEKISNTANKAVFTINAPKTVYGASLVGGGAAANTKGDVAGGGTLFCYKRFAASRAVVAADVINLTYEVEGESA